MSVAALPSSSSSPVDAMEMRDEEDAGGPKDLQRNNSAFAEATTRFVERADLHCRQDDIPARVQVIDIHKGRPIRLQVKVLVPVTDHPNFNFVGKLLGPKGNSLKRLQEATQTRMAILGKGSMRDKNKEEELRSRGDPKHAHLHENLHVDISTFAPAVEAYARIAHALAEVKRFLVPDYYDDIRQHQLRELALLNGDKKPGGGSGAVMGNGAASNSPLSSPTSTTPPPPESARGIVPPPQTPTLLRTTRPPLVRIPAAPSSSGSRTARLPYPYYSSLHPTIRRAYRRVPVYRGLPPDTATVLVPEHEDSVYNDGYPGNFYDHFYGEEYTSIREPERIDYEDLCTSAPTDRSYEGNGYAEDWNPSSVGVVHRLKSLPSRTLPRSTYREKPYALPTPH